MSKAVENRQIVLPGQDLYEGTDPYAGDGTYIEDGNIKSLYLGTVEFKNEKKVRVIPSKNKYMPKEGDTVIGEISQVSYSHWMVDIRSPYEGMLQIGDAVEEYVDLDEEEITDWYELGDTIVAKIENVSKGMDVKLTMQDRRSRSLEGGRIINISPSKVPRLIGSKGVMVQTIKEKTNTSIIIGQNGRVWIEGQNEKLASEACRKVDREAHISGLTDKVEEWLEEKVNQEVDR
ncbi:MAG: exosome complex RNA-binding protein Rrp4 [Candidatus Nanohaloarchaeota archaeon QJJ-9]|nr:exosome complex RNA-binding protein Rrp4 [Candidatus Nanohaloarchaeota archaeon QJJ-9]